MSPDSFRDDLKRFDKRLDFTYNPVKFCWEVIGLDRKNVKYVIKSIPIGQIDKLGPWVLQELYDCSPTKQGGEAALNRKIDAELAKSELADERAERDRIEAASDEAYLHFKHKMGQRVSFCRTETSDSGIVVNDKRRVQLSTV